MHFVIHAEDRPDASSLRLANYEAHKAYLAAASQEGPVRIVMSGPLVSDDGQTMRGSLFILEAPDRLSVEEFHRADPFASAGIWERVSISAFFKRQG
jgi:uncharacterized protein YciI